MNPASIPFGNYPKYAEYIHHIKEGMVKLSTSKRCYAFQCSDSMVCNTCNLVWDVNDPHPPQCGKEKAMTETKSTLADAGVEIPIDAVYELNKPRTGVPSNPYGPLKQEQRTVYVTPDGQEFREHREAIEHRLKTIIECEFLDNPLYSDGPGGRVSLGKITDWIISNAKLVQHIKDFHIINWKKENPDKENPDE